jgi:uncharacterized protein (UPF0332 family)
VATPNPDHLFEQAERLIEPTPAKPRQVDIRRAVSTAYYARFHGLLTAAGDEFIGVTKHTTTEYALLYRSITHAWLRQLCDGLKGPQPIARFKAHTPIGGFGPDIQALALAVLDLQEKRHTADYDPLARVRTADALLAIRTGRRALEHFTRASTESRKRFLALLVFPPRG